MPSLQAPPHLKLELKLVIAQGTLLTWISTDVYSLSLNIPDTSQAFPHPLHSRERKEATWHVQNPSLALAEPSLTI